MKAKKFSEEFNDLGPASVGSDLDKGTCMCIHNTMIMQIHVLYAHKFTQKYLHSLFTAVSNHIHIAASYMYMYSRSPKKVSVLLYQYSVATE